MPITANSDGSFQIDADKSVNITITKSRPNCAVGLDLDGTTLTCQASTFPTCKKCSFTAPHASGTQVTLTASFDFQSDAQGNFADGDKYTVQFSDESGSTVPAIHIFPPPADGMVFLFFVR